MASYGPGDSSEDAVKVYTTDTIVDHPGAEIVYKGFITLGREMPYEVRRYVGGNMAKLTEEAKERAKKLNANAIVGVKITDAKNGGYTFIGTTVRYYY